MASGGGLNKLSDDVYVKNLDFYHYSEQKFSSKLFNSTECFRSLITSLLFAFHGDLCLWGCQTLESWMNISPKLFILQNACLDRRL